MLTKWKGLQVASVFTEIINGNLPAHAIWRDTECVSFLSINPISDGHCLVVPIAEVDHWVDLPTEKVGHLLEVASIIGQSQMKSFKPSRIGQMIAGFEVPHTHLHVLPINDIRDLDFRNASSNANHDQLAEYAKLIRKNIHASRQNNVVKSFAIQ
jgi:diadenosine tetraphosphate (Ap4A) HIT family hydrolase|tara:strand:+ start:465 stop:929 length:465 start_codon:yes stop_codon:yes gene_type:complete